MNTEKLLLANKAGVNARRDVADKPIDAARRNHNVEVIKILRMICGFCLHCDSH